MCTHKHTNLEFLGICHACQACQGCQACQACQAWCISTKPLVFTHKTKLITLRIILNMSFSDQIKQINVYSDLTILAILIISQSYLFIRLKFKVDKAGIITLLLYLVIAIIRFINDFGEVDDIGSIASFIFWFMLIFS